MSDRSAGGDRRLAGVRADIAALVIVGFFAAAPYWRILAPPPWRAWFVDGDFVDQFFAFARFETARLAAGELPLWNPYAYAGSPFWADVQAAVAYPPSLVVTLASAIVLGRLPFLALELEAVAHVILAGGLTYHFARRVLGCRAGAMVAALAFGMGGWVNGYAPLQLAVLESGAWLPLALWGVDRWLADVGHGPVGHGPAGAWAIVRRAPSSPGPLALGLAIGMAVLAGHPQTVLYILYAVAAWGVWRTWLRAPFDVPRRLRPALKDDPNRPTPSMPAGALGALGGLLAGGALGALVSAAGWLPAAEFLRASNRAQASFEMLAHGFPPRELLGIALPGLTLWSPLYVGILPLALAVGAARATLSPPLSGRASAEPAPSAPGRHDPFWLGLGLIALLLSMGGAGPLFDLAYHLAPGFDLFRGQERAAFLVSFALAMLAGSGAARWRRGERSIGRTALITAAGLVVIGALVAAVAAPGARPAVLHLLAAGTMTALVASAGLGLLPGQGPGREPRAATGGDGRDVRARWSTPEGSDDSGGDGDPGGPGTAWLCACVALVAADLFALSSGTNTVGHPPGSTTAAPLIELVASPGVQRVEDEDRFPRNSGVLHGFESTSGASPLRLATFQALRDGLSGAAPERLRSLLAVSHVLSWRESLPNASVLEIDARGEPTTLFELSPVAPYAWRAIGAEAVPDDAAALARLLDPAFEPLTIVLLHAADPGAAEAPHEAGAGVGIGAGAEPIGGTGITDVRERAPGLVRVRTSGDARAWIVFSEMHAPGWRATLDGGPTTVHRANVALMAVAVPPGEHEIVLRYRPRSIALGIGLSLTGVLIALAWTLRALGAGSIARSRATISG